MQRAIAENSLLVPENFASLKKQHCFQQIQVYSLKGKVLSPFIKRHAMGGRDRNKIIWSEIKTLTAAFWDSSSSYAPLATIQSAISRAYATPSIDKQVRMPDTKMYGRRLPNREVHLSLKAPIKGWTSKPDSGPASHTNAVNSLDNSKESRYGVP